MLSSSHSVIIKGCKRRERKTNFELDDLGSIPGGTVFSLCHSVRTGSWVHPASYPVGTGAPFSGQKRPGREANNSLYLVPRLRMWGAIPPLSHMYFMAWCSVKLQGQLYLYLWKEMTISIIVKNVIFPFVVMYVRMCACVLMYACKHTLSTAEITSIIQGSSWQADSHPAGQ
jgi:hypothetical protein